eukprot:gene16818-biopygen4193
MADKLPIATERSMLLRTNTDESGEQPFLVEIAPNLSAMNHRLYRQSRLYNVRFETSDTAQGTAVSYEFYTLPDNWFVRGAVKYAHRTYMQNHDDELASGVKFSKWHDFRVSPQNPDGTYEFTAGRMFDGDDSEEVTAVQPYGELLDLKDAEQMVESGDRAPYDRDFSSMIPDDETVDDVTGQHILTLKAFSGTDRNGGVQCDLMDDNEKTAVLDLLRTVRIGIIVMAAVGGGLGLNEMIGVV